MRKIEEGEVTGIEFKESETYEYSKSNKKYMIALIKEVQRRATTNQAHHKTVPENKNTEFYSSLVDDYLSEMHTIKQLYLHIKRPGLLEAMNNFFGPNWKKLDWVDKQTIPDLLYYLERYSSDEEEAEK